ncbi:MOSC domain-containing protein [Streptomyces fuscichromogenes]|uniref:MOSC domain-containing protein n=1 Tax=Streptomyces fuscichromogenes TaxID=1324013 RepID=UPI0038233ADD
MPSVAGLYNYPIKGLTQQSLTEVTLRAARGFPFDREIALARPGGGYRAGMDFGIDKTEFYALVSEARLSGLTTHLEPGTGRLTVGVRGHTVLDADINTAEGRDAVLKLYARVLDLPPGVEPVLARDEGRRFTDTAHNSDRQMHFISLINLATVRDFAARVKKDIDPLRFRANIYIDGLAPWQELTLLGREFRLGDVTLRGTKPTGRCAATEVEPGTGHRDIPVPQLLTQTYGHQFMGIYVETVSDGLLRLAAELTPGDLVA